MKSIRHIFTAYMIGIPVELCKELLLQNKPSILVGVKHI